MPAVSRKGDKDNKGDTLVEGSATVFAGDSSGSPSFSNVQITMPKEYEFEVASPVIKSAGRYAPVDEPVVSDNVPEEYPEDVPPAGATDEPKKTEEVKTEEKPTEPASNCNEISEPIDYSYRLSPNFVLSQLSTQAYFPHNIKAQGGRSVSRIVCNLQALCENIGEKIAEKHPGKYRINSGFRKGSGRSQHERGQAMDLQFPSFRPNDYLEFAKWIADNLNFDQLIMEHGNSVWIHVSYDREKPTQRNQVLTMYKGKYTPGLNLHY